jgi:hypothetical protein
MIDLFLYGLSEVIHQAADHFLGGVARIGEAVCSRIVGRTGAFGWRVGLPLLPRQVIFSSWIADGKPGVVEVACRSRLGKAVSSWTAWAGLALSQASEPLGATSASNSSLSC